MICREIEIFNKEKEAWDRIPVSSVFNLAVISSVSFPHVLKSGYYGINIGISIPMSGEEDDLLFVSKYWTPNFKEDGKLLVYLIGDNGEKVPVDVREGNRYDEAYESICLFGYIVPEIIASDSPPEIKNKDKARFGSYKMQSDFKEKKK